MNLINPLTKIMSLIEFNTRSSGVDIKWFVEFTEALI